MLEQNPNQFGIQLAQDPPPVSRAPFINLPILLPKLVDQLDLPSFSQQNDRLFQTQVFGRCIGEQQQPIC